MRRALAPLALAVITVSACGSGGHSTSVDTLNPAAAIRAAADQATSTSSKLDMSIETKVQGQDVTISGTGAFGKVGNDLEGTMTLSFNSTSFTELITGGNLYLQLPNQPGYFKLPMSQLVGTQFEQSSNPGSAAELLKALGDAKNVGATTVRGVATTHYTGTINVADAVSKLKGGVAAAAVSKLQASGVSTIPVDAYLDAQRRLRRLTENISLTVKGTPSQVTTQIDFYDFGTTINVQAPPAAQVKDGSALLNAIKGQFGG